MGTKSWLQPDISSIEIFPEGYQIFRADRKSKASRGGGVLVLVRNGLICSEQPQFKTKCELIWVKLEITNHRPLFIRAYYRPREDDLKGLQELQNSVSQVRCHSDNVWVLGDFNLPKLTWPESVLKFRPDYSHKQVYDVFLNLIHDYNFTQVVSEPTQQDNI